MAQPTTPQVRCGSDAARQCFFVERRLPPFPVRPQLDIQSAYALAELLPLLGCGEEAAVAGFQELGNAHTLDCGAREQLRRIADDERGHDAMLRGLRAALPVVEELPAVRRQSRRFHRSMSRGGTILHLARIAALDAAVCTIVSRLLRPGRMLSQDEGVRAILRRIRDDETRHVLISRNIALAARDRAAVRAAAAEARSGIAQLLACAAQAFEALGVDPDRLLGDIARLPNGLLPR